MYSFEGWYVGIFGIKVVVFVIIEDVCGMFVFVLVDFDLVLIFEYVGLYNMEGELLDVVDVDVGIVDIYFVCIWIEGKEVLIIIYGGLLFKVL